MGTTVRHFSSGERCFASQHRGNVQTAILFDKTRLSWMPALLVVVQIPLRRFSFRRSPSQLAQWRSAAQVRPAHMRI